MSRSWFRSYASRHLPDLKKVWYRLGKNHTKADISNIKIHCSATRGDNDTLFTEDKTLRLGQEMIFTKFNSSTNSLMAVVRVTAFLVTILFYSILEYG